jgi:hypothetical protein
VAEPSPAETTKKQDPQRVRKMVLYGVMAGAALGLTMAAQRLDKEEAPPPAMPAPVVAAPVAIQRQPSAEDEARKARYEQEAREFARQVERDMDRKKMQGMDQVVQRWSDAFRVASATPKIALAGPVSQLQAIRRDAVNTEVPDCLLLGKLALMESMNETLEAFIMFMRSSDASNKPAVDARFDQAGKRLQQYASARNRCLQ